jgi:hypothetical protein
VRQLRWAEGVRCPEYQSKQVNKRGFDETQTRRQRYQCKDCQQNFDDLSGTIFAGPHQPLKVNMPVMKMGTAFVKFMSTRWKVFGLCYGLGSVRIVAFPLRDYPCIWGSLSSFIIPVSVGIDLCPTAGKANLGVAVADTTSG